MKERLPPQSIESEQALLGALLMDTETKQAVYDLKPDMFWKPEHREIFKAIMAVDHPDMVTVAAELERAGHSKDIGGASYLTGLVAMTPSSIYAGHYAQTILRCHILREFLALPTRIQDLVYSDAPDVDHTWAKIRQAVDAVQPVVKDDAVLNWPDTFGWYLGLQSERVEEREQIAGGQRAEINFCWKALSGNGRIKRLRPGTLTVVVAEAGAGKTAFAECCAEHWAKSGFNVLFFHFELSHEIMLDRRAARHTDLSMDELDDGVDTTKLGQFSDNLYHWPGRIDYVHCPGWNVNKLIALAEKHAARRPVHAIVIDYFQKIAYDSSNRFQMTSAQARGQQVEACKNLAEGLQVPILMVSQFNRDHKIRDTGELLEKANIVIEIKRGRADEASENGIYLPIASVVVAKNTMGPTFETQMFMCGKRYQWADVTKKERE